MMIIQPYFGPAAGASSLGHHASLAYHMPTVDQPVGQVIAGVGVPAVQAHGLGWAVHQYNDYLVL